MKQLPSRLQQVRDFLGVARKAALDAHTVKARDVLDLADKRLVTLIEEAEAEAAIIAEASEIVGDLVDG